MGISKAQHSRAGFYTGGTVFKITPGGMLTTLYKFCAQLGCADGYGPYDGLVQATNGNFYGTTAGGGAGNASACDMDGGMGWGTIFEITPEETFTTLHAFENIDGSVPDAGLIQATDGNLYGTTPCGGTNGAGTVFEMTLGATLTTLDSFPGSKPVGAGAEGGVVEDTNGEIYGSTTVGGTSSDGTLFSLSVGLSPFVKTLPTSGKVGAAVTILGNNLKDATSVTFNGIPATITSDSNTEIKTTVPTGATTGFVKVTTASGKVLTSNVKFRIP